MWFRRGWFLLFVLLVTAVLVGCSPAGSGVVEPTAAPEAGEEEGEVEHGHEEGETDHEHAEGEDEDHDHSSGRIPNEGAVIRIVSPADGALFTTADEVLVEVETENFDLSAEGKHWHVYVDGVSYGMIVGGDTDHALRNLEPGEREISVYLSIETHEEMEDGDAVIITVE
jgi:hypothetical protein